MDFLQGKKKVNDGRIKAALRRVSIFKRLNVSFMLLLLLTAVFLTFFSFYNYSAEISENINSAVSLLVQNVKLKVQDSMQEYEEDALDFYNDSQVIAALKENAVLDEYKDAKRYEENKFLIENKLYNIKKNKRFIVNTQFVSPTRQYRMVEQNGFNRGGMIRDMEQFYQSDFYLLPQEKRGYPVWLDTGEQTEFFYKNEQSLYGISNIVTLCIAVYEPFEKQFLGVLFFNIDLNAFAGAMEGYENYPNGNTYLVGSQGVLLSFSPHLNAPAFPRDKAFLEEMKQKQRWIERREMDGKKVLLAYEKVPGTDLFAVHAADIAVLFAKTYQIRNLCILVLLGTVVACFVISYYVTVSISDPVKQLIEVMEKAGDGKWTARYPNSGNDEITVLGDRFNEMADKTDQLIEQVYLSEIRRQEVSLNWKNAQLNALLMQINPHFLYNTLDIIRWEAMYEANGESRVTQMIEKFSQLCRMGMRAGGNTIPLKEGIAHASTYLEVINFRHSHKIGLKILCGPEEEKCYIPQFMLQPIMENAVIHGFEDASRGFNIQIEVLRLGEKLMVSVEDNGKGMGQEELEGVRAALEESRTTEGSIGLANVNQRIRLFYGEAYGIRIESSAQGGTRVEISLPVRTQSENMEGSSKKNNDGSI